MTQAIPPPIPPPSGFQPPEPERIYAIGDIHGHLDLLNKLTDLIAHDMAANPVNRAAVVYLGDYIDRGMNSKGVIHHLIDGPLPGLDQYCLKGNHEDFLLRFLKDETVWDAWVYNGCETTMRSYGVDPFPGPHGQTDPAAVQAALRAAIPKAHVDFLQALLPFAFLDRYYFAHAGVRPGVPLDRQNPADLMWIRHEFLEWKGDHGAVIVHGHTPTFDGRPQCLANRICVDTGAYKTGVLTSAVLEGDKRRFLNT